MKKNHVKHETVVNKLCDLYRTHPDQVTFTIKYRNDMPVFYARNAVRGASEICFGLDIDGLSVKSILCFGDKPKCQLIVNNNTLIPEIKQNAVIFGQYNSCNFAADVYRRVSATYAATPLSRRYQNAIINVINENAANIRPIVACFSGDTIGYKVAVGPDTSIRTEKGGMCTKSNKTELTLVNKNPELPLPAHVLMEPLAPSHPGYTQNAEFAARVNQLMHDLYMAQNVR